MPSWVENKDIWDEAITIVEDQTEKSKDDFEDENWAAVTAIYKNKGGKIKKKVAEESNDYLGRIFQNEETQDLILDIFTNKEQDVTDTTINNIAITRGMSPVTLRNAIYQLAKDFWAYGEAQEVLEEEGCLEVDELELEIGAEVEMEHTRNSIISKRIALDHIAEVKDFPNNKYYEMLEYMEELMKAGITKQDIEHLMDRYLHDEI